eukprot:scaffold287072_cov32-Tisochrysis_lutea.AAC.1
MKRIRSIQPSSAPSRQPLPVHGVTMLSSRRPIPSTTSPQAVTQSPPVLRVAPAGQLPHFGTLNGWSCAMPMTMARPLQKPTITGSGRSEMKRSSRKAHTSNIKTPASMTDAKTSSIPAPLPPGTSGSPRNVLMMAAKAPVAPSTIPGRPPNTAHVRPTIHAECKATGGRTRARYEKAMDSGICAMHMIMPNKTSRP